MIGPVTALVIAVILVPLLLVLVVYFLMYATRSMDHRLKRMRYEAGNPPSGASRPPTLYQFFGYVIMFIALDPIFMLLFILPLAASEWSKASLLTAAIVAIILPPLFYALRYAKRIEYWTLD